MHNICTWQCDDVVLQTSLNTYMKTVVLAMSLQPEETNFHLDTFYAAVIMSCVQNIKI